MAPPVSEQDAARWRRVEEICDAALHLAESERDSYLNDACGADQVLRREVEALLVHEQTADKFLSVPLGALAGVVIDPPRDLLGKTIAGYDIVAKLGEGGMGEVYRAHDRRLGRDVALKVLPAAVANDHKRLKRFEREARLLASVNHAGIGAIYGVVDDDGIRALVLEIVEGVTLADTLERGPLKAERALALAAQIADALDHAHRRGITHRDLKPSNIMTTTSGVKLLDFGIGKWTPPLDVPMTGESTLTGEDIGTLIAVASRRPARIRHIAVGARQRGALVVNDGALRALMGDKASLLPIGVVGVEGTFDKGDVVEIRDGSGRVHGRGLVNYPADACRKLAGRHSEDIDAVLGWRGYDALITRDNLVMGAV